jgi:uncharacterized membrane protein
MAEVMAQVKAVPAILRDSAPLASASRIVSVDFLRGLVMVIMAIDHARDYLTNIPFEPEDVAHTYPALFFTRWITHFCAPLFFFLAGTGAYLLRRRTGSVGAVSKFLWTRGLWLILLEFTIIEYAWTFVFWQMGGVIWALGACMILLALLVRLPDKVTLGFGLALILFHDLFDAVRPAQLGRFGWLWVLLHRRGMIPHTRFFVLFPLIPLLGVMAAGYVFGKVFDKPAERRSRIILWLGVATTTAFIVLRGFNAYGNPGAGVAASTPGPWHIQSTLAMSIVSFLDVEKYPPSLQYLLMTIGPALILLSIVERNSQSMTYQKLCKPIVVFGQAPLFFYILHLYAIHLAAIALAYLSHQPVEWLWRGAFWMNEVPDGYGHGLPVVYATWLVVLIALYFPCAWFAQYRRDHKKWWLSYL